MSKLPRSSVSRKAQPQSNWMSAERINGRVHLPLLLPKPPSSHVLNSTVVSATPNESEQVNEIKPRCRVVRGRRRTVRTSRSIKPVILENGTGSPSASMEGTTANGENGSSSRVTENATQLSGAECQANYEEFVRTFAVPTHLYRYLANRHRAKPTYLTRNLRYMHPTGRSCVRRRETLEEVAARLSSAETMQSAGLSLPKRSIKLGSNGPAAVSNVLSAEHQWPDEIEIIMEGFSDSEKENDWVTVESSVNLFSRVAWAWRRNFCPLDSLVLVSRDVACNCNGETPSTSAIRPALVPSARFRIVDVLRTAAALDNAPPTEALVSTICSRASSAQLELEVHVIERRRARHINGAEAGEPLGQTAYPVVYSTSSLPLFFTPEPGSTASSFLLTPGIYELRLGIQAAPIPIPEECITLPISLPSRSVMALEGGTPTAGNGDHRVGFQGPSSIFSRFPKGAACAALDEYSRWPHLRFRVIWHSISSFSPFPISIPRPHPVKGTRNPLKRLLSELEGSPPPKVPKLQLQDEGETVKAEEEEEEPNNYSSNSNSCSSTSTSIDVIYLFFYGGDEKRILQWTKTRDMICPWCKLDCRRGDKVYPSCLMAHLRCCHPRFRFSGSWQRETSHLVLEVTLDESYDGSNDCVPRTYRPSTDSAPDNGVDVCLTETSASRNPHHLPLVGGWTGYCGEAENNLRDARKVATSRFLQRRRRQPLKRLPFSQLIYWRGVERFSGSGQELTGEIASMSAAAAAAMAVAVAAAGPLEVGHKRVYFHTTTLQPIEPTAFDDCDSEDEDAPQWLRDHYQRKVEEFTDVNKGEKEFMQIWNAFLLSIRPSETVVSDSQMGHLLLAFVQRYGDRLHRRRLRNNFILHLANLYDYGLVAPSFMRKVTCAFDDLKPSSR
ncbi:polycomb protein suz12 A [Echinococcus multilocularis]|uniref:Polycomb protein suz12 A n=1 Tax=Echinococcus multilocularis TaxID=6211 RepID=A0A068Y4B0_ECHMU|nr:polycomb protein suz12 A [Echinococcus multilocularis]